MPDGACELLHLGDLTGTLALPGADMASSERDFDTGALHYSTLMHTGKADTLQSNRYSQSRIAHLSGKFLPPNLRSGVWRGSLSTEIVSTAFVRSMDSLLATPS